VGAYGPLVYHWARQAGLQDQDAADIGQEVFRTVADRIATFRHEQLGDTFRGWLWTITRNKLGDFFRRQAGRPEAAGGTTAYQRLQVVSDSSEDEPSASGVDPDVGLLHRALDVIRVEFEGTTWQAFWRITVEGERAADVAEDLGMTAQAARQAKYRVLRRLRNEMT